MILLEVFGCGKRLKCSTLGGWRCAYTFEVPLHVPSLLMTSDLHEWSNLDTKPYKQIIRYHIFIHYAQHSFQPWYWGSMHAGNNSHAKCRKCVVNSAFRLPLSLLSMLLFDATDYPATHFIFPSSAFSPVLLPRLI